MADPIYTQSQLLRCSLREHCGQVMVPPGGVQERNAFIYHYRSLQTAYLISSPTVAYIIFPGIDRHNAVLCSVSSANCRIAFSLPKQFQTPSEGLCCGWQGEWACKGERTL